MCNCGCNTCETKGPLLTEGKVKSLLSEGLQYHIDKKIPLFETVYRIGSDKHLSLIKEARKMYSRNVIDLCEEDEALINTHLGEFALYEGESVPLDLPMLEESNMPSQEEVNKFFSDTQNEMHYLNSKPVAGQKGTLSKSEVEPWDEYDLSNWKSLNRKAELNEDRKYNQEELLRLDLIARRKFDCDYEKCTDEQKDEILKDKVKVGVKEALQEAKKDIYDKFLDNPSSPKGRAKSLILKFIKEYGDDASSMAVDRFASKNNLKPEEKYILKYITKNDIKISSQPGGPDFSALNEADDKLLKIKQELEALRPGTISWIDDIFISSYDGSLQVELDYTLYPDEIKQLAQIAAKYGMELKYMTGKNATLVKNKINEDRKYNQEELLRLDLIARRRFDCV